VRLAPALPWSQPGWWVRAQAWIDAHVEAPLGDVREVKIRPWSAVLRQPTRAGDVYFKANLPALANEPALTRLLHRICPEHVLGVLADEPGEGWMLQADGGPTLASLLGRTDDRDRLERMLAVYAQVQVRAAGHVDELVAAGAPDRRLPQLRQLFEDLVGEDHPGLLRLAGRLGDLAAELDAHGLPATIDHSDLHAWNVLAPGDRYVVFDWHEAAVTHPFFSMLVATRSIEGDRGRLVDAYLEPWAAHGSRADLKVALDLALRLGPVTRALAWNRVLAGLRADAAAEWGDALEAWLRDLETELERP
jgi:hypothetical protein